MRMRKFWNDMKHLNILFLFYVHLVHNVSNQQINILAFKIYLNISTRKMHDSFLSLRAVILNSNKEKKAVHNLEQCVEAYFTNAYGSCWNYHHVDNVIDREQTQNI